MGGVKASKRSLNYKLSFQARARYVVQCHVLADLVYGQGPKLIGCDSGDQSNDWAGSNYAQPSREAVAALGSDRQPISPSAFEITIVVYQFDVSGC